MIYRAKGFHDENDKHNRVLFVEVHHDGALLCFVNAGNVMNAGFDISHENALTVKFDHGRHRYNVWSATEITGNRQNPTITVKYKTVHFVASAHGIYQL